MASKAMIMALRQQTGAGLTLCKQALEKANGDMGKAVEWLQAQGVALAATKSGRAARKGAICVDVTPCKRLGVMLEVNVETEFAAKNEAFLALTKQMAAASLKLSSASATPEGLLAAEIDGKSCALRIKEVVSTLGENIQVPRMVRIGSLEPGSGIGIVGAYLHNLVGNSQAHGLLATMVAINANIKEATDAQKGELDKLARQLAMHVTAEGESEKPLLEQDFLQRGVVVKDWVLQQAKAIGCAGGIEIVTVKRCEVGETAAPATGQDFAAEVERQIKKAEAKRNAGQGH